PDFIAEVERVLNVLDGAVLVISAVEGVQSQTRVLMRALRRLRIPTVIFVNKTDRAGADPDRVVAEIAAKLVPDLVPIYRGSARTGAGIAELITGITEFLTPTAPDANGPATGTVFKVERGPARQKIAYVRMFTGTLRVRDRLPAGRITGINVFEDGRSIRSNTVTAGRIGRIWGLTDIKIGDTIGTPTRQATTHFAPPTLETVVRPCKKADKGALHAALTQLAEQDPLINLRLDETRQEIAVSLYGEVQKEVIQATLADEFGLDVTFRETTTICIERLTGAGTGVEIIDKNGNPFLATIGLRIEPGPLDSGVRFALEVELGSMPLAFITAVEDTVSETLRQGMHGWQVTDCVVTMTHSGYWARQSHAHGTFDKSMSSTAGDFRNLTPLVLMTALARAGTTVHEPMHHFALELPADALRSVLPVLSKLGAIPRTTLPHGDDAYLIEGDIPAARVRELEQQLPGLTGGEGSLDNVFDHYRPVRGAAPTRPRSDHNPLDRREYLIHVVRRV
ncbi:MAG TPA: GTP-binding protein, partial [Pseudonocardiaceae bacterium]|nr:GTP-binding protein [Pseudonocardiaceae bacterium]